MTTHHTGENIAEELQQVIGTWDLKKVNSITTDNAANELKAISIAGYEHFSCIGHNINLAV